MTSPRDAAYILKTKKGTTTAEENANARLIMAAPALLDALKAVVSAMDYDSHAKGMKAARAAIAKAEGRTS